MTLIKVCQKKKVSDLQSVSDPAWPRVQDPTPLCSPFLRSDLPVLLPSNVSVQDRGGSPVSEHMLSLMQNSRNTNGNYSEIPFSPSVAKGPNPVARGADQAVGCQHSRSPMAGVGAKPMY